MQKFYDSFLLVPGSRILINIITICILLKLFQYLFINLYQFNSKITAVFHYYGQFKGIQNALNKFSQTTNQSQLYYILEVNRSAYNIQIENQQVLYVLTYIIIQIIKNNNLHLYPEHSRIFLTNISTNIPINITANQYMYSTTYIHKKLSYFFSRSEIIDLQIGNSLNTSINYCLDVMQQAVSISNSTAQMKNKLLQAILSALAQIITIGQTNQPPSSDTDRNEVLNREGELISQYSINTKKYAEFYQNDGLKCSIFGLNNYLQYLSTVNSTNTNNNSNASGSKINLVDEMIIKGYINLIYTVLYGFKYVYKHQLNNKQLKIGSSNRNKDATLIKNENSNRSKGNGSNKEVASTKNADMDSYLLLKTSLQQLQFDSLLIKMVTLTLQAYYLPIKKLVMLYARVLVIMFHQTNKNQSTKRNLNIQVSIRDSQPQDYVDNSFKFSPRHPDVGHFQSNLQQQINQQIDQQFQEQQELYEDREILQLCTKNQLTQNYLQVFKDSYKPEDIKSRSKSNPIQQFYAKNNVGDCPLAQSIVVGLLRSLLTICNSQVHKKFQNSPPKGTGADSYREWQVSYQFIHQLANNKQQKQPTVKDYKQLLSQQTRKLYQNYIQYNQLSVDLANSANTSTTNQQTQLPTHYQFYRHKIYTTSAISTFFSYLLIKLKENTMIQFTYLYQLISDANGILVFLKFLTDKFQYLQPSDEIQQPSSLQSKNGETTTKLNIKFKDQVMLTVYSVLLVLYGACNNYTEKTKSYLFQYNSYLIIKKIPHIFMKVHKNDDQLPSEEEIQAQFGSEKNIGNSNSELMNKNINSNIQNANNKQSHLNNKVKELTQLCYSLLKIQIPFFSKKMKQNSNNMKMIVDIYCQMPKKTQAIKRTQLDKLLLKNKMKKTQNQKYICSVQELKALHNEYNNLYYWSNQQSKINQANEKQSQMLANGIGMGASSAGLTGRLLNLNKSQSQNSQKQIEISQKNLKQINMTRDQMDRWLEENVWRFYD